MALSLETGEDNEILRKKSKPVQSVDKKLLKFIKEMEVAVKKEKGVGLAAPQVGLNQRIIVVLLDNKKVVPMINPEITSYSDEIALGEEGCLSLPGKWGQVKRYQAINVKYLDERGGMKHVKLEDFNARVVQHEIDHLDGILFTDYLNAEESLLNVMHQPETERL